MLVLAQPRTKQTAMTINADNVSGQAPSLLPTGRQGSSSESVSILRDLDPRATRLASPPSFSYKTILLVAAPLAIGAALLSGYLYSSATGDVTGTPPASAAGPTMATARETAATPVPPTVAAAPETASSPMQEDQGPATILGHPDTEEGSTGQAQSNPLSVLAEDKDRQLPASSSNHDKAIGKSGVAETGKRPHRTAAPVHHAQKTSANKAKPQKAEKRVIEHEVDIITAIVKGSQN